MIDSAGGEWILSKVSGFGMWEKGFSCECAMCEELSGAAPSFCMPLAEGAVVRRAALVCSCVGVRGVVGAGGLMHIPARVCAATVCRNGHGTPARARSLAIKCGITAAWTGMARRRARRRTGKGSCFHCVDVDCQCVQAMGYMNAILDALLSFVLS
ncbi:hypothetical protein B0H12DRAFT_1109930 [Mycena haematopus]|nr:hypothetical protein B0H12DRAFT_1109930 [Mycena haematopus]